MGIEKKLGRAMLHAFPFGSSGQYVWDNRHQGSISPDQVERGNKLFMYDLLKLAVYMYAVEPALDLAAQYLV